MTAAPILVLGGAGFIGGRLVEALARRSEAVVALARRPGPALDGVRWVVGDLTDPETVREALAARPRAVIHAVTSHTPATAQADPAGDILSSLVPLVELLRQARAAGVGRHVLLSSGGTVYGPCDAPAREEDATEPVGIYGATRLAAEKYLRILSQEAGAGYAILRLANVYGPGQAARPGFGLIANAVESALADRPLPLFNDGRDKRDYVHVDDVVRAVLIALDHPDSLLANIGSGQAMSARDVVDGLETVLGRPVPVQAMPSRGGDVTTIVLDISRARRLLDWSPSVSFADGLRATVAWRQGRGSLAHGPGV